MPEYLTPGVYVEETSFRSRSIEGVPTSTFGMAGRTAVRPGAVQAGHDPKVTMTPKPLLVTSYTEYERRTAGCRPTSAATSQSTSPTPPGRSSTTAAGGSTSPGSSRSSTDSRRAPSTSTPNFASLAVGNPAGGDLAGALARRGRQRRSASGSSFLRSKNMLVGGRPAEGRAARRRRRTRRRPGEAAYRTRRRRCRPTSASSTSGPTAPWASATPRGTAADPIPAATKAAFHITSTSPSAMGRPRRRLHRAGARHAARVAITKVLQAEDPSDDIGLVWLDALDTGDAGANAPTLLERTARPDAISAFLTGGGDGRGASTPTTCRAKSRTPTTRRWPRPAWPRSARSTTSRSSPCPDTVRLGRSRAARPPCDNLIEHCEQLRYRIAIVDPPDESSISGVREFRSQFDTKYARALLPVGADPRPDARRTTPARRRPR